MKDMSSSPFLSVIIPAHNEERRLPISLNKIDGFLRRQSFTTEVIVVENGSSDRTLDVARAFCDMYPYVRAIAIAGRGKGLAVRAGMLAARGEYRFICDADLSMPIEQLLKFLPPELEGCEIAIASREIEGARRVNEPPYRHLMGRVANQIIKTAALPGLQDTQCGFKMFRRQVAEDLFGVQRMGGIGFDIEILFVARKRGYEIREVPVAWYYDPDSRIRLLQDSLHLLSEIHAIRRNWKKGLYGEPSRIAPTAGDYQLKAASQP